MICFGFGGQVLSRKREKILVLLVMLTVFGGTGLLVVSRSGAEKTMNSEIDALRSANESVRFAAKDWIYSQGENAVEPVYDLLKKLTATPLAKPQFILGKEIEGKNLWAQLNEVSRSISDGSPGEIAEQKQAENRSRRHDEKRSPAPFHKLFHFSAARMAVFNAFHRR